MDKWFGAMRTKVPIIRKRVSIIIQRRGPNRCRDGTALLRTAYKAIDAVPDVDGDGHRHLGVELPEAVMALEAVRSPQHAY